MRNCLISSAMSIPQTMSELIDAAELVGRWPLENMSESEKLR
jgi:hypothetical protein